MTEQQVKALVSVIESLLSERKQGIHLDVDECEAIAVLLNYLFHQTE